MRRRYTYTYEEIEIFKQLGSCVKYIQTIPKRTNEKSSKITKHVVGYMIETTYNGLMKKK